MATKQKKPEKKAEAPKKENKNTNLGLGSLRGAMNGKGRRARMDAYLQGVVDGKKQANKKKK